MDLASTQAAKALALAYARENGIAGALATYGLTLDDVAAWARVVVDSLRDVAGDEELFLGRLTGTLGATLLLGVELERAGETRNPNSN